MNTFESKPVRLAGVLVAMVSVAAVITGCATTAQSPAGAAEVRSKLSALKSNAEMADQVPVQIREAEAAVVLAEKPVGRDAALSEHLVYMADRQVEIAMATAVSRSAEAERAELSQARDDARLKSRTLEADAALRAAATAQTATAAAQLAAAESAENSAELQRQIALLQAEATDRGLVLTLGDVLFATGRSDLKVGGTNNLDKLVAFLNEYPNRRVDIEGHTDDVGSVAMNQTLSEQRADSVKSYLLQKGIQSERLVALGLGETRPIADNLSATGRQQNRRVEVIIKNPRSTAAIN